MSTAVEVEPPVEVEAAAPDVPFDLTFDLFDRIVEAGLLPEDRRIYLRDGRLYEKMAKSRWHGFVGAAVNRAVVLRLPDGWSLWPESTLELDHLNAPLPDFAVIRGSNPLDFGALGRHPGPGDVGMLIEVAVTSLRDDLGPMLEKYARAGIPAYWGVDVPGRRVLLHAGPRVVDGRGSYAQVDVYRPGDSIPLVLDGREAARIPFDDLLR